MIEALISGQRNPRLLAELAKGRARVRLVALAEALDDRFTDHHARWPGCCWTRSTSSPRGLGR